jgi:DNA-directed RNA polymerase specialized sigma24 family protein
MQNGEFDLDVTFEESDPDLSGYSEQSIRAEIEKLADALRPVAQAILLDKRTMSDVSQSLGLRQAELVNRLHRAKLAIAEALGNV